MSGDAIVVDGCEPDCAGDVSDKGVLSSLMYMQSKDLIDCSAYLFGMAAVFLLCFMITAFLSVRFAEVGEIQLMGIFACLIFIALAFGSFMRGLKSYRLGFAGLRYLARTGAV